MIKLIVKQYRWLRKRNLFKQCILAGQNSIDLTDIFGQGYEPSLKKIRKFETKLSVD